MDVPTLLSYTPHYHHQPSVLHFSLHISTDLKTHALQTKLPFHHLFPCNLTYKSTNALQCIFLLLRKQSTSRTLVPLSTLVNVTSYVSFLQLMNYRNWNFVLATLFSSCFHALLSKYHKGIRYGFT